MYRVQIHRSAGKQVLERQSFRRCVRMQWKVDPLHINIEILLQLFNTPGTEITPGSDKIGEDLECRGLAHTHP